MTISDCSSLWKCIMLISLVSTAVSAMVAESSPSLKLRVCQGSSCLGKCRGIFNPLTALEELVVEGGASIELEETFCMNQCKRGPNVRMINTDNGKVLAFEDPEIMNETEANRKAFQGIGNEARVQRLWGIANGVADGSIVASEKESADKLHDIMPGK